MIQHIAVYSIVPEKISCAEKLAEELKIDFLKDPSEAMGYEYLLVYTSEYLGLLKVGEKQNPFYIDFLSGKMLYRCQTAGLRKELLARAIGLHPCENPTIIDATAGIGRDSFILASLGFNVTLIERSPILHALLIDAIERASKHSSLLPVIERMHLVQANSIEWLANKPSIDVIYLDPMFPERKKSASVKKEMVVLQDLLGKDVDSDQLLSLSLTCAAHRIVVKRPRLSANILEQKPNFSLVGKSSRFDVYLGTNSIKKVN